MAKGRSVAGALFFWTSLERVSLSFPFSMSPHQKQVSEKARGQLEPPQGRLFSPLSLCSPTLIRQSLSACLPLSLDPSFLYGTRFPGT